MKDIEKIIETTAAKAAAEVVRTQRRVNQTNFYGATERLLRAYPRLKDTVEHPEQYGFIPPEKSKSITVAPPSGSGVRDREEILIDTIEARKRSFERTLARFTDIDSVVRHFEGERDFTIIRMYYWNEDFEGNRLDRRLTFEDISDQLYEHNIERSVKSIRKARTRLVQEMTVMLFGVDGALAVEMREPASDEQI